MDELANETAAKSVQRALVVDLDGTLIRGDTLWESAAKLARQSPLRLIAALAALARGRAAFKKALAERVELSMSELRLNEDVVGFVKENARSRPVVLATAADQQLAEKLGGELGLFAGVLGTKAGENLKGARKLRAIRQWAGDADPENGFDYIGDSPADRPVWSEATKRYVVAPDEKAAKRIMGSDEFSQRVHQEGVRLRHFAKAMRPHQWVKNVLIFVPLALSHQIVDFDKLRLSILTFIAFSLCASASYVWNDILDVQADRAHPRKRERPIASGAMPIPLGFAFSLLLLAVSFSIAVMALPAIVAVGFAGYIAFTLTYSLYLKQKLLVDAMSLGLLYGYRILIGGAAANVVVSDWLIAFSTFFFFGLALVKRYSEIARKPPDAPGKLPGRGYYGADREIIGVLGVASSFVSILVLALYLTSPSVVELYARPTALWMVCLVLIYWLSRVWVLAYRGHMPDDPIVFALRDRNSILAGAICMTAVFAAL